MTRTPRMQCIQFIISLPRIYEVFKVFFVGYNCRMKSSFDLVHNLVIVLGKLEVVIWSINYWYCVNENYCNGRTMLKI